jgi:hypothetical protein
MDSDAKITTPPTGLVTDALFWQVFVAMLVLGTLSVVFVGIYEKLIDASTINMILGVMLGWVGSIVTFKFGTSSGSQSKDAVMADLASKGSKAPLT